MIIKIKELYEVEYIDERDSDAKGANLAIRRIEYDSDKKTLLEAFEQFENNFDIDKVIDCDDEFDGECLDTIKTLSVEELSCIQKKAVDIVYYTAEELPAWLPKEMYIPSYIKADEVADYISDTTGYLVEGFVLEYAEVNENDR